MTIAGRGLWMPANGSLHGVAVDRLMRQNLIALAVCFVIAHLLMAVSLLRRHRRWLLKTESQSANGKAATRSGTRASLWMAVPLLLLCALYGWMAFTGQRLWAANRFEGAAPGAMHVEVVGVQFQWYFRYPGEDAAFGRTRPELVNAPGGNPLGIDPADPLGVDDLVASELVLPSGREVDVQLRALDVIHGFFVPGMRLKQNAVPGLVLHVHFTPVIPGEYPILCSQVCGLGHARMQAKLRVVSPQAFDEWLRAKRQRTSVPPIAPPIAAPTAAPIAP